MLFSLVAGLLCGGWLPEAAAAAALLALLVAGRPGLAVAAVAAVLAGAGVADERRDAIDHGPLPAAIGTAVTADVTVLEPLRRRATGEIVARVGIAEGPARGEVLLLRMRERAPVAAPGAAPGDVLRVSGRLELLGGFDEIHRRRGALAALRASHATATGRVRGGALGRIDAVRRAAERGLAAGLSSRDAALLAGMALGQDDRIDDGVREAFQASGLAHLLAVSGTNVMLLATLVLAIGAIAGVPLRARLIAALVLVAVYVPLTGAGPSIQRAGIMGAAGLVAALAGRPSSRWYALGLAAAATLVWNPYAAAEPGWQLSFAAVIGLLWFATPLREALERRRVPAPVAEAAAMTIAASAATAPLMAALFERVSLVSLPANLVAAPAVAPVMWLGMLAAAVGQVSADLAWPLNFLNAPLLAFIDAVAAVSASVPGATIGIRAPGIAGAAAGYGLMAVAWFGGRAATRRVRWRGPGRRPLPTVALAGGGLLVAVLVASWLAGPGPWRRIDGARPGEVVVSFLDVGQGDATLVQRDGAAVLFDTGPPDGDVVGRLRDAGVKRLDALVLTHPQLDHHGAALPVVARFRPRLVVDGALPASTALQRRLPAAAARSGGRVIRVTAGDVLRLGALTVRVLWPPAALAESAGDADPNDRALVAHVSSGAFDLLLPADAESDVTAALTLPEVDALKVAHHGSEDTGLPAQLARLKPQVAAITVGRGNSYGHPAPSTLAALRAVPHVYRTDRDGTVRLRAGPGGGVTVQALGQ